MKPVHSPYTSIKMIEHMRSIIRRVINKIRPIPRSHGKRNDNKHPNIRTELAAICEGVLLQDQSNDGSGEIYIGKSWIGRYCELTVGENNKIRIGDHVTINPFSHIMGDITIENFCAIAPRCFMSSGGHSFRDTPADLIRNQDLHRLPGNRLNSPITIEEDAWIGAGVFIQAGITIGRGSVVGAGSVVLKDTKPYEIVAGAPAKKIGERLSFTPKASLNASSIEDRPYFYRGFLHHKNDYHDSVLLAQKSCSFIIAGGGSVLEIEFDRGKGDLPIKLVFSIAGETISKQVLLGSNKLTLDLPQNAVSNRWGDDREISISIENPDSCDGESAFGIRSIRTH